MLRSDRRGAVGVQQGHSGAVRTVSSVLGDNYGRGQLEGEAQRVTGGWRPEVNGVCVNYAIKTANVHLAQSAKKYSMSPPKHCRPPRGPGSSGHCMATNTWVGFCLSQMTPVLMGLLFNSSPSLPKGGVRGGS